MKTVVEIFNSINISCPKFKVICKQAYNIYCFLFMHTVGLQFKALPS